MPARGKQNDHQRARKTLAEASADELRPMVAAQLLADRARRRALGLLQMAAVGAYRPQPWARPAYLPHPRRRLLRVRGGCGFIENGDHEGRLFPTPTDAPRRLPAPNGGRPGAGYLRCPAPVSIATP